LHIVITRQAHTGACFCCLMMSSADAQYASRRVCNSAICSSKASRGDGSSSSNSNSNNTVTMSDRIT
jgi:hypothetical protein